MPLFDPVNVYLIVGIPIGLGLLIGLMFGILMTKSSRIWSDAVGPSLAGSFMGGVIGALVLTGVYTAHTEDINSQFQSNYQVSVVEGSVPTGPNDTSNILMFTRTGGPVSCVVSTDDTKYTVTCDGKELRPIDR